MIPHQNALYRAANIGDVGQVQKLIKERSADSEVLKRFVNAKRLDNGNTALHAAVLNNDPEIVELLMGAGADPDIRNGAGQTVLHYVDDLYKKIKRMEYPEDITQAYKNFLGVLKALFRPTKYISGASWNGLEIILEYLEKDQLQGGSINFVEGDSSLLAKAAWAHKGNIVNRLLKLIEVPITEKEIGAILDSVREGVHNAGELLRSLLTHSKTEFTREQLNRALFMVIIRTSGDDAKDLVNLLIEKKVILMKNLLIITPPCIGLYIMVRLLR